jgi:hypothetical protein
MLLPGTRVKPPADRLLMAVREKSRLVLAARCKDRRVAEGIAAEISLLCSVAGFSTSGGDPASAGDQRPFAGFPVAASVRA